MPKALTRLALALAAASLCAAAAPAQTQQAAPQPAPEWVAVSPAGEEFAALMPKEPLRLEQELSVEELAAAGRRYTATAPGARYVVWALKDTQDTGARLKQQSYAGWAYSGESSYLDLVAEAAWELLVKPEFERLDLERQKTGAAPKFLPSMSYRRAFQLGGRDAREYTVRLEVEGGPVFVCADGPRLYVVAALARDPQAPDSKRFVDSFAVGAKTPNRPAPDAAREVPMPTTGGGPPAAPNAPVDYERPFKYSELVKRAVITYKPEPGYTEWARRFDVAGVVRLRAILFRTGEVTNIYVVKSLPHGLTEKSIEAARRIRFEPAQKDGRIVSQYVVLEYNFNMY